MWSLFFFVKPRFLYEVVFVNPYKPLSLKEVTPIYKWNYEIKFWNCASFSCLIVTICLLYWENLPMREYLFILYSLFFFFFTSIGIFVSFKNLSTREYLLLFFNSPIENFNFIWKTRCCSLPNFGTCHLFIIFHMSNVGRTYHLSNSNFVKWGSHIFF